MYKVYVNYTKGENVRDIFDDEFIFANIETARKAYNDFANKGYSVELCKHCSDCNMYETVCAV